MDFQFKSLNFWDLISNNKIQIPPIQRDFAQGRTDYRSSKIRKNFLNEIFGNLYSGSELHLDFVFGTNEKNVFVPVDGQQRLTTLFLLHYYLAIRIKMDVTQQLLNFNYATRASSTNFCQTLVRHKFNFENSKVENITETNTWLSNQIKDAKWFEPDWKLDPTISSLLVMLDAIHENFDSCDHLDFWRKLTIDNKINFSFLDMGSLGLDNDLYLKMNSRGRQLTDWENFKADFEKFIDDENSKLPMAKNWTGINRNGTEVGWKELLDTEWTDIFWKNKDEENFLVDEEWLRFFRASAMYFYALEDPKKCSDSIFEKFHTTKFISISDFSKIAVPQPNQNLIEAQIPSINLLSENNLNLLFQLLEKMKNGGLEAFEQLAGQVLDLKDKDGVDFKSFEIFKTNISKSATYKDRVYLVVLFEALMIFNLSDENQKQECARWFRLWRNLIENSSFSATNFSRVVSSIKNISSIVNSTKNVNDSFFQIQVKDFGGLVEAQILEEIEKLKIIHDDIEFEKLFLNAENHEVFQGRIKFLIEMSREGSSINKLEFENLSTRSALIFSPDWIKNSDYLLHRGLLSDYDYSYDRGGNMFTYGHFEENWNSWKKVLANPINLKRENLKKFILSIDIHHIRESIENKIDHFRKYKSNDYRYFLINDPFFFGWSKLKQISRDEYWLSPDKLKSLKISLCSKTDLRGEYREYFTFCIQKEIDTLRKNGVGLFSRFDNIYQQDYYFNRKEETSYLILKIKSTGYTLLEIWVNYEPEYFINEDYIYYEATMKIINKEAIVLNKFFISNNYKEAESENLSQFVKSFSHDSLISELQKISQTVTELGI